MGAPGFSIETARQQRDTQADPLTLLVRRKQASLLITSTLGHKYAERGEARYRCVSRTGIAAKQGSSRINHHHYGVFLDRGAEHLAHPSHHNAESVGRTANAHGPGEGKHV